MLRRRQGLNNGKDGQGSPTDPETVQEDGRKMEVVEPPPEPDPSARDEFHQAYAKMLQDADKGIEDLSRTLDSVSYPVSDSVPLSHNGALTQARPQALLSSGAILLLIDCESEPCSASTSLPCVNVIPSPSLLTIPIRVLRHLSCRGCHFAIAVRETVLEIPFFTRTPSFVDYQEP